MSSIEINILSLQSNCLGHVTYRLLMEQYFRRSHTCKLDAYWFDEEKELLTRILGRLTTGRYPNRWVQRQNLDFGRFRAEAFSGQLGRRLVQRKLRDRHYDILHFHTQVPGYLSADLMRQVPTVITGDITAALVSRELVEPRYRWTYCGNVAIEKRIYQAAYRAVFWSDWARQSAIKDLALTPEHIEVVYPGLDLSQFEMPERAASAKNQLPRLLFVGGDFTRKGGHDVLEVFLANFADQAYLDIMTSDPEIPDVIHPHVSVHRGVRAYTPEWLRLYQSADLFVLPTYFDAFGLAFLEAMAMGLPIIATNTNAIPEIVEHGTTGLLINPKDRDALARAMQILIQEPALRQRMGWEGRQVVENKFDAVSNFSRLEQIFCQAAEFGKQRKLQ